MSEHNILLFDLADYLSAELKRLEPRFKNLKNIVQVLVHHPLASEIGNSPWSVRVSADIGESVHKIETDSKQEHAIYVVYNRTTYKLEQTATKILIPNSLRSYE